MSAAANAGRMRLAPLFVSRFLFTGLAVLGARHLARALGQPVLSHPASTTLSLIATAFAMAALGLFVGRLKSPLIIAAALAFALVLALASALPLSPSNWSRLAVQTAVTGTGTRAAASALLALLGLGLAALIGARLKAQQTALVLVAVAWAGLTAYATLRPGPPLPGGSAAPVAPIARSFAPGPALESGLARITRQIEKWPPAAADPVQRARNLLLIVAVPDLYGSEPLQSHLPHMVLDELRARLPADALAPTLRTIAANPAGGSVAARTSLPKLGLPAHTGNEAKLRARVALHAEQLRARL
jgi:hypothetical protein